MKFPLIILPIVLAVTIGAFAAYYYPKFTGQKSPNFIPAIQKPKPLEKYAYENLSKTDFKPTEIIVGDIIRQEPDYTSRMFYFSFDPYINSGQTKKVSGLINLPNKPGTYPILLMLRGYVDKEKYTTGEGTQHAGEYFTQNGFITIAPDFLGYGQSDDPSDSSVEERFQSYVTVLTLLKSIPNLNSQLSTFNFQPQADVNRLGIWAHSNGGQIALSVLEIGGGSYPTVLWAPVSKPFPYSILYFTDDIEDHGKALRSVVAAFENDYNSEKYSPTNFYSQINAPIQLHQGTGDETVPLAWSDNLNKALKDLDKSLEYFTYPEADHNLTPGWNQAITRSLNFYQEKLTKTPPKR